MRLYLNDLKDSIFWGNLPNEKLRNLTPSDYLVFFYDFDDNTSRIVDIKEISLESHITLTLYKKAPIKQTGEPYKLGYLKLPFETQNVLFYQFLYYFFVTKGEDSNKKLILDFFRNAKSQDLKLIDERNKQTTFNNIFKINSRINVKNALDKFLIVSDDNKREVMTVLDILDSYTQQKHNEQKANKDATLFKSTIFGEVIEKIVLALRHIEGGFIPDTNNKMRYLYVGQTSGLVDKDPLFELAKRMFREKYPNNDIFTKTGYFFNSFDNKWRKAVSDLNCTLVDFNGDYFIKKDSNFQNVNIKSAIEKEVLNGDSSEIKNLLESGYDVYLSDFLKHDTLYKYYPKLNRLPVFFAYTNGNQYSFYSSPEGYILMYGNKNLFDFKTILLHEVQHEIQKIENFSTGGNQFIAKLVNAVGGKDIRSFFLNIEIIKKIFVDDLQLDKEWNRFEKFNFYGVHALYQNIYKKDIKSRDEYVEKSEKIITEVIWILISYPNKTSYVYTFLSSQGSEVKKCLDEILDALEKYQKVSRNLMAQIGNPRLVDKLLFNTYESLMGEIESRSVQQTVNIEEELQDYLLPYTSESLEQTNVVVLPNEYVIDEKIPSKPKAGIEKTNDNTYIIHLIENPYSEPFLHEIGHIIYDMLNGSQVNEVVFKEIEEKTINDMGGVQEVFCELFLCYIVNCKTFPELEFELEPKRKLLEEAKNNNIKAIFDDIFYLPIDTNIELKNMYKYLLKLNEIAI